MVVVGNPPYSNFGQMNRGEWILGLLEDYKVGLHERKLNLDDDFVKFIRFGQWRIEQTLCDWEEHNDWFIVCSLDLPRSRSEGRPVLILVEIEC